MARRRLAVAIFVVVACGIGALVAPDAFSQDSAADPASCLLCEDAKSFACTTCGGDGAVVRECDVCDGERRAICYERADDSAPDLGGHSGTRRDCPNELCNDGSVRWDDGDGQEEVATFESAP